MEKPRLPKDRVFVALDVSDEVVAEACVSHLVDHVGGFVLGPMIQATVGTPAAVAIVKRYDGLAVLDGSFNLIPSVLARTVQAVAKRSVDAFTVAMNAGIVMMEAAVAQKGDMIALSHTVPTSLTEHQCQVDFHRDLYKLLHDIAHDAAVAGMDGVICAGPDAQHVRSWTKTRHLEVFATAIRPGFVIAHKQDEMAPRWMRADDQVRYATPAEAIRFGADRIIVGRPILDPPRGMTVVDAARRIVNEVAEALAAR